MSILAPPSAPPLPSPFPAPPGAARRRHGLRALWILLVALALAAAAAYVVRTRAAHAPVYVTVPAARGTLVQTVTAEGTVNPQNLVLVGTQISGTIAELDVDYNSPVRRGQVMARIDPTAFRDALAGAQASQTQTARQYGAGLAAAEGAAQNVLVAQRDAAAGAAALGSAEAQVGKTRAARDLAALTLRRDRALLAQGYVAQNQADADASSAVAADAAYAAARLAVGQARAQLASQQAAAQVALAQARGTRAAASATQAQIGVYDAQVRQASYNLRQSVIVSPVAGTVIARNVSVGQTVAASFQTPTLFSIAQDLSKMQVDVAVGEPDVGGVRVGEVVEFTVLAYPNRIFRGIVSAVRRNPTTVNNVVTYDTVVDVQNRDGALFPGMTANATIHIAKVAGALLAPVAALQYAPPRGAGGPARPRATPSSPWGMTTASATRTIVAGRNGRLFVLSGATPRFVAVRIALVSGSQAAVVPLRGSLRAGAPVIVADDTVPAGSREAAAAMVRNATAVGRGGGR